METSLTLDKTFYQIARQIFEADGHIFVETESPVDSIAEFSLADSFEKFVAKSNKNNGRGISAFDLAGNAIWTANFYQNTVSIDPV